MKPDDFTLWAYQIQHVGTYSLSLYMKLFDILDIVRSISPLVVGKFLCQSASVVQLVRTSSIMRVVMSSSPD